MLAGNGIRKAPTVDESQRTGFALLAAALAVICGPASASQTDLPDGMVARGNEPFWTVVITEGSMQVTRLGTKGVETFALPTPVTDAATGARSYAVPDGPTLTLVPALCRDSATGMPFPVTVTLADDGGTHAGCGGDPKSLLTGAEWAVTAIAGRPVAPGVQPGLTFTPDGGVAGSTGCNRFTGPAKLSGEGLRFASLATTRMACAGPAADTERAFLDAISRVDRFDIGPGGDLLLIGADATLIAARR
jgi:heat shock protein HslJ